MRDFVYGALPVRVVFSPGSRACLATEVAALGIQRALMLCTPHQRDLAEAAATVLGQRCVGVFDGARMHVPVEVARTARTYATSIGADGLVVVGGGSAIGLAKGIALEMGLPIVALPTTYAGSEMTPLYGLTEDGVKKTGRDTRVLPRTVVYDPELTLELPLALSVASGLNAIAHAAEGLYAHDGNPVLDLMAEEGIRALATGLTRVAAAPRDAEARSDCLYGAWLCGTVLCGTVLGQAGVTLHHKLCHVLGGSLDLPHAETHAVMLPHTLAYNAPAAPAAMRRIARALGRPDAPRGLHELAAELGAPTSLRELGVTAEALDRVTDLALNSPYANPRPLNRDAIAGLLARAWSGVSPEPCMATQSSNATHHFHWRKAMKRITRWALSLIACASLATAGAAELRIGVMTTLSGSQAVPGVDMRDGIELAVKQLSGKVGGQPTRLIVADDQFNPGAAKQIAERLVKKDKVQVLTGIIYSNILLAAAPVALENGNIYLSSNAGPSQYAGAQCDSGFFSVSWQNDAVHEAAGKYAQDKDYKRVVLIAPNYPAGRDATTGFKRFFKGEVLDELYPKLGQLDFAVEIARLREQKPDAVYFFLPGGMGINFTKQYRAAGISDRTVLVTSQFSADQDTFAASGDAMLGVYNTGHWSTDTDNAPSREFVAGFEKAYGRLPSFYASQGYDAIMMIDGAVRATRGNVDDPKALRKALSESQFKSVRGKFSLGANRFPVQDFFVRVVSRDPKGRLYNKTESLVLSNHADAYGAACTQR